jgi:hypothetical protein
MDTRLKLGKITIGSGCGQKNGILTNKILVALGHSLIYGNKSGTQYTWPSLLAKKRA